MDMEDFKEILERSNVQSIRPFILSRAGEMQGQYNRS